MSEVTLVAGFALALLAGLLVGYLFAGRHKSALQVELATASERAGQVEQLRQASERTSEELAVLRDERQKLEVDLAEARAQHANLLAMRDALREERDGARSEHQQASGECARLSAQIAQLTTAAEKEREANEMLIAELRAIREQQRVELKQVAQEALDQAQQKFLARAQERFVESETSAKQAIGQLLQPVHERLARYEDIVGKVEAERRDAFGNLAGQIEAMRADAKAVSSQAANLVNALRNAPKVRGNWGEQQLRNVLEQCGLSEHTDFATQVSVAGEDGRILRPDAIVRVPGEKVLVIDAKVSINAYQDAISASDDEARERSLKAHAAAVRSHVLTLGDKAYWDQFEDSPQFVIMFVPGEHLLTAALDKDGELWDFAFKRKVLLATPTNLIAIARTVDAVWKQEKLTKDARQIGLLGKEVYDRLAKVGDDLAKAGGSLNRAVSQFNEATGSFNRNLAATGRKFRDLPIEFGKRELEDVPAIEALATHASGTAALPGPANDATDVAVG